MNVAEIADAYKAEIAAAAAAYSVRPGLIAAIIEHESAGDPAAVGDGGKALGLMQMHREAALDVGCEWSALGDPATAIMAGAAYLRKLLDRFDGDERKAVMAYNVGVRTIKWYKQAEAYADAVLGPK